MKRRIVILGATGSIGKSTLDLIERAPDAFEVVAVTAATNAAALADIARRTNAQFAVVAHERRASELAEALMGSSCRAAAGEDALIEAATMDADLVVAAIVGCAGLRPTMAAVEAGRTVALANKEALVTAGALMTQAASASGATLLPVDSEHNAIFQCLAGNRAEDVSRLILTASGGPFRTASAESLQAMTPAQAVAHPNWSMGAKISVDSATLMNKGLELIEAHYLFGLPSARIDIVVHPQSVIHSLVEYVDGSVLAQLGSPDMRIPLSYALAWPARMATPAERLDLQQIARLDFEAPDLVRFPALRLAREALEASAAAPIVLNAANEVAVERFLAGKIGFTDIPALVERCLDRSDHTPPASIAEVLEIDRVTRDLVGGMMEATCP
ncbi:1-deoxy-D-xylulose-5-phosphate reductoisomerase [Sphingomonas lutea]|uniref:1-deoxy-D-xylulose 5-phosphate reductoisomerase n=1 Tax=Sphingomonas lutea TaxID=1045317 RepID=A0A7G9SFN8_9SPHN|nr:1-deoxy-D-xylulose-5-phosphate reductoisomerase [Sphingomonas lutea]QNN66663.1 1-deoxy-D-xylulose-5-phosphate reductoisomerase [Sphingomonas lutea]